MSRIGRVGYRSDDGTYRIWDDALLPDGSTKIYKAKFDDESEWKRAVEVHNNNQLDIRTSLEIKNLGYMPISTGEVYNIVSQSMERRSRYAIFRYLFGLFKNIVGDDYLISRLLDTEEYNRINSLIDNGVRKHLKYQIKRNINLAINQLKKQNILPVQFPKLHYPWRYPSIKERFQLIPNDRQKDEFKKYLSDQINNNLEYEDYIRPLSQLIYLLIPKMNLFDLERITIFHVRLTELVSPPHGSRKLEKRMSFMHVSDLVKKIITPEKTAESFLFSVDRAGLEPINVRSMQIYFQQIISPKLFARNFTLRSFKVEIE